MNCGGVSFTLLLSELSHLELISEEINRLWKGATVTTSW